MQWFVIHACGETRPLGTREGVLVKTMGGFDDLDSYPRF